MRPETLLAWRTVLDRRKVLIFVVLALAVGIANKITLDGMAASTIEALEVSLMKAAVGDIIIWPSARAEYITSAANKLNKLELLPDVLAASPRLEATGFVERDGKERSALLFGIVASKEQIITGLPEKIVDGEFIGDRDDKQIVLGAILAEAMEVRPGQFIDVVHANGETRNYKIKGIVRTGVDELDRRGVWLTYREMQTTVSERSLLGIIRTRLEKSPEAKERLANLQKFLTKDVVEAVNWLERTGLAQLEGFKEEAEVLKGLRRDVASKILVALKPETDPLTAKILIMAQGIAGEIQTAEEFAAAAAAAVDVLVTVNTIFSFLALVVAVVMVAIVLYINVMDNIRLIGVLKAIGTRNALVVKLFVVQGLIYALIGGLFGIALGYGTSRYFEAFPLFIPVANVFIGAKFSLLLALKDWFYAVLFAVIGSAIPAYKAATLNIVEAMRLG